MNRSIDTKQYNNIKQNDITLLSEQTSQLYDVVNNALAASILNSIILTIVLWPSVEHDYLLSWLASVIIISLLRSISVYHYKKADVAPNEAHIWTQRFLIGSIASSVIWGATTVWIFPAEDLARQVFLAFVIGGMAAASITSLSYIKRAVYIFLGCTLIPLLIRFFISGTELSIAMGAMLTLYLFFLFKLAKQTHDKSNESINMHIDNIRQQRSLNESEHRYEILLNTATDAFFLHDLNGKILDVNQQACKSLGYTKEELLNLSVADLDIEKEDSALKWDRLNKGENINIESVHCRKDGSTFPVEVSVAQIYMGNEPLISVFARDITERKRIEKMKNEFVSTVSHELRTPLTSIRGSLGLITGGAVGELPTHAKEMLTIAGNNTERLLFLINDILDIQKIETGELDMEFEKTEVSSFLKNAIEDNIAYADQFGVSIALNSIDNNLYVNANEPRLMQVMANLLSNAAKFSHQNGVVEVAVDKQENNCIRISVTDHGDGIAKEFYNTIFDKFTQQDASDTKQKGGTGLGLNITKAIIEKHGGEIGFISSEGEGTTFYFDLPELVQ